MYTCEALLDVSMRSQRSLAQLIAHCQCLSEEELSREIEGFGYPTIQLQLHHVISAQRYWIGVLEGRIDIDEDEEDYRTATALEKFRQEIQELTEKHVRGSSVEVLNTARMMMTWGHHEKLLTPAHVVLRTLMHIYQHQGQIAAMCRLLEKPIPPGLDFPLGE